MAITFFRSYDTTNVDTYINRLVYAGLASQGEGIDLRIEMNRILYGHATRKPKGHWVILRKFNRTQKSEFYNKRTHEGVHGPAYTYTDHLLRTRRVPLSLSADQLDPLKAGIDITNRYVYYFEYTVHPQVGDDIFELDVSDHARRPSSYSFTERYLIKRVHPYRLENGNIQYYSTMSEFDEIRY